MKRYNVLISGHATEDAYAKGRPQTEFLFTGTLEDGIDFYYKVTALLYKGKAERVQFVEIED